MVIETFTRHEILVEWMLYIRAIKNHYASTSRNSYRILKILKNIQRLSQSRGILSDCLELLRQSWTQNCPLSWLVSNLAQQRIEIYPGYTQHINCSSTTKRSWGGLERWAGNGIVWSSQVNNPFPLDHSGNYVLLFKIERRPGFNSRGTIFTKFNQFVRSRIIWSNFN